MSVDSSLASFNHLATEILFEIFDYLSYNDVVYAFWSMNQRFIDVLFQYHRFLKAFTTPTRDFPFWQTILPVISSQIQYLTITATEFPLSLDSFPNLKSLVVDSSLGIDWSEIVSLLKCEQFKKLNSLKIKNGIIQNTDDLEMPFFYNVLKDDNDLRVFEFASEICYSHRIISQLKINHNLRSLTLKVIDLRCLLSLLPYTPNLKSLNLSLHIFVVTKSAIPSTNILDIKLKKCSIFIECGRIHRESFLHLIWFIKQFSSSLVELALDLLQMLTDKAAFTGLIFQQQVLESMVQLKSLHFYIQLDGKPTDVEGYLSAFRNSFWLEHQWTVAMHGPFLYTLPFHFDTLYKFTDSNSIKCSNESVLHSPQAWSRVKSIQFAESCQYRSDLIEQLQINMPNLTSVIFTTNLIDMPSTELIQMNRINPTLTSVTTVHCAMNCLQSLKYLLFRILPDIKCLMLSYSSSMKANLPDSMLVSQEFDKYLSDKKMTIDRCYSFKIQRAEIKVTLYEVDGVYQCVVQLLKDLLTMSDSLQTITFHFYHLPRFPSIVPYTDLDKTIELFHSGKLREKYCIKRVQNYIQFVRTNDK